MFFCSITNTTLLFSVADAPLARLIRFCLRACVNACMLSVVVSVSHASFTFFHRVQHSHGIEETRHYFIRLHRYAASAGDWSLRLWNSDSGVGDIRPLLSVGPFPNHVTSTCWSRSRPSVLFSGLSDGTLHVWDLLRSQTAPVVSQKASYQWLRSAFRFMLQLIRNSVYFQCNFA